MVAAVNGIADAVLEVADCVCEVAEGFSNESFADAAVEFVVFL